MVYGTQPYAAGPFGQLTGLNVAEHMSAFNFCSSTDELLPFPDATISALDRQHLWGMFIGIVAGAPVVVVATGSKFLLLLRGMRGR